MSRHSVLAFITSHPQHSKKLWPPPKHYTITTFNRVLSLAPVYKPLLNIIMKRLLQQLLRQVQVVMWRFVRLHKAMLCYVYTRRGDGGSSSYVSSPHDVCGRQYEYTTIKWVMIYIYKLSIDGGIGLLFILLTPIVQKLKKNVRWGVLLLRLTWGMVLPTTVNKNNARGGYDTHNDEDELLQWITTPTHRYAGNTTNLYVFLSRRKVDLVYYIIPWHVLTTKKGYNTIKWVRWMFIADRCWGWDD